MGEFRDRDVDLESYDGNVQDVCWTFRQGQEGKSMIPVSTADEETTTLPALCALGLRFAAGPVFQRQ